MARPTEARQLRSDAKEAEDDYWREMDRAGGEGKIKAPPKLERQAERVGGGYVSKKGGDYDWFYGLSKAEQKRLRSNWFSSSSGAQTPDEVEERGLSMKQWLALTRGIDAARAVRSGRGGGDTARYGGRAARSYVTRGSAADHGTPLRKAKHRDGSYHDIDRNANVQYFTDANGEVHPIRRSYSKVDARAKKQDFGDDPEF